MYMELWCWYLPVFSKKNRSQLVSTVQENMQSDLSLGTAMWFTVEQKKLKSFPADEKIQVKK